MRQNPVVIIVTDKMEARGIKRDHVMAMLLVVKRQN